MKICHCVTMTDEEDDALHIVLGMLEELENDYMIAHDFEDETGLTPGDMCSHLREATAYLERWQ